MFSINYKENNEEDTTKNSKVVAASNEITTSARNYYCQYDINNKKSSVSKIYKNINELKMDSDIIIEGVVKDTKQTIYVQMLFTISQIEVYEVYKGDVIKGATICLIEPGGIMDKESIYKKWKEKFPQKEIDINKIQPSEVYFDGIPPLQQGDKVLVFASKYPGKAVKEGCYEPVGLYQGKFIIEGENVKHQLPPDIEKGSSDISAFRPYWIC